MTVTILLTALALLSPITCALTPPRPVVNTSLGSLEGVALLGGADAFLGVPYATPPIDGLRFLRAIPRAAWEGTRDASEYGAACVQNLTNSIPDPENFTMSEDCLFLNVWRPSVPSVSTTAAVGGGGGGGAGRCGGGLLPVFVYIHGGSFMIGSGAAHTYRGTNLTEAECIVTVTLNYRLGALGFLATNLDGDGNGSGAMQGINDMIEALAWLKSNIAAFGGDPARITIAGQSAGGTAVCVLLCSPRAAGLFQRAVVESGPCIGPWAPGNTTFAAEAAASVLAQAGVASFHDLQRVPAVDIFWPNAIANNLLFPGAFLDGKGGVMPEAPLAVLERAATAVHGLLDGPPNGPLNAQHVIIGATNRDGITPFYNLTDPATGAFTNVSFVPTNASAFPAAMEGYWTTVLGATNITAPQAATQAAAVLARYPITRYDAHAASAFVAADGDYAVLCPLRRIADLLSAAGVRTYEYTYSHTSVGGCDYAAQRHIVPAGDKHWASHGSELPFVFRNREVSWYKSCAWTAEEKMMRDAIGSYWATFAATGSPNAERRDSETTRGGADNRPAVGVGGQVGGQEEGGKGEGQAGGQGTSTPVWEAVNSRGGGAERGTMQLDVPVAVAVGDPYAGRCGFWGRL